MVIIPWNGPATRRYAERHTQTNRLFRSSPFPAPSNPRTQMAKELQVKEDKEETDTCIMPHFSQS